MGGQTRGRRFGAPAKPKVGDDFEDYLQASGARADEGQGPDEWGVFELAILMLAMRLEV